MIATKPGSAELDMNHIAEPPEGTESTKQVLPMQQTISADGKRRDLLRRATSLPYREDLLVMAKTVRLETNSRAVVESALEFFARYQWGSPGNPQFLWRIVSQQDSQMDQAGVALSAFSDRGLRFANIEQRSFLAVDLETHEGIGFVADGLVECEPNLNCRSLFDTLFCMTAGSLGILSMSAACVGLGEKGLLIFGPPNTGKTTVSYLAAKLGFEYHADQAVFLEIDSGKLQVWGDLLPAIFRSESLQFLPELRASTRRFSYPGLTVHYLPKRPFQAVNAHPVTPACLVFLNRADNLTAKRVPKAELSHRFAENTLLKDDDRFQIQTSAILRLLGDVPAYDVAYGGDPAAVANWVRQMLVDHDMGKN
jgi:hypothetical protein